MVAEPKTGVFDAWVKVGPAALDGERAKVCKRGLLFKKVGSQVAVATEDNREYELVARIGKWEPTGRRSEEKLRVDFTLVLVDALEAEIGERVKDLPQRVPAGSWYRCALGSGFGEAAGRVFERGCLGWQRIE